MRVYCFGCGEVSLDQEEPHILCRACSADPKWQKHLEKFVSGKMSITYQYGPSDETILAIETIRAAVDILKSEYRHLGEQRNVGVGASAFLKRLFAE